MTRSQKTSLKEEIIDKSIKLILQKGYKATRVEDITDATSVSKAAFYLHFESKGQLLETIVDRYESLFLDPIIKAVRSSKGDFLHKMKYSHKWLSDFAYDNRDLCVGFMTISAEMVGSGTKIETKIEAIKGRYRALFKELLEQGRREGMIKETLDIDLTAHVINAIHNGALIEWYAGSDQIDGAKFALTYRNVLLSGILK